MPTEKWEYLTEFEWANIENKGAKDLIKTRWPNWKDVPKFAPESMIPRLNELGEAGWELIHMEPVEVGKNYDIGVYGSGSTTWTSTYLCVFKRRKGD